MSELTITVEDPKDVPVKLAQVFDLVSRGIKAGPVVVKLGRLARSAIQNRKYHAIIGDIANQVTFEGRAFKAKIWKAKLVEQFEKELNAMGKTLRVPSEVTRSLDGERIITVRPSTTDFNKKEAAQFIEYIYSYGSDLGVRFTDKALSVYDEYKEARAE